jgi:hypothetical protein
MEYRIKVPDWLTQQTKDELFEHIKSLCKLLANEGDLKIYKTPR